MVKDHNQHWIVFFRFPSDTNTLYLEFFPPERRKKWSILQLPLSDKTTDLKGYSISLSNNVSIDV